MYIVNISGLGCTHRRGHTYHCMWASGTFSFRETTSLKDDENVN